MVRERTIISLVVSAVVLLLPIPVAAQTGTIAGAVKDTTGAVMPGVTVEAASPALIERVRTAFTDGQGEYKIVDLRPGVYNVTFTLNGFSTVKREGIDLTAGVTANVSAELRVGTLEETITVSGRSPLVDIQNTTQHQALTRRIIDDLPTGRQWGGYAALLPGVITRGQDVGGSSLVTSVGNPKMGIDGSNPLDMLLIIEGMRYGNINTTGACGTYVMNNAMVQEIAIDTSGATAEVEGAGVRANIILKQGANRFSSTFFTSYTDGAFQKNNLDDALRARGAQVPSVVNKDYDVNAGFGGPIKQDKLWFYASYRNYGLNNLPTGASYGKDPLAVVFVPDLSRTPIDRIFKQNENGRVTWQTSRNSKLSLYGDAMQQCDCGNGLSATTSWEATTHFVTPANGIYQAIWNWTVTNRLLVELGETMRPDRLYFEQRPEIPDDRSGVVDAGTGILSRAYIQRLNSESRNFNGKALVSYVTGSQSLKVGTQWFHGDRTDFQFTSNNSYLNLVNGVPIGVTQRATPYIAHENLKLNLGIFAQEQWTRKRLTTNLGVRFDYLNEYIPAQHMDPVTYIGARDFAPIYNVPNWKDLSPRFGASYDLFGNGKTAFKWSLGRYLEAQGAGFPEQVNPMRAPYAIQTTRAWTDINGNFVPDCQLTNLAANGECGAIDNRNFGKVVVPIHYDSGAVTGWGTRTYNWELMAGVQHELRPGLSVEVSYHRRSFGNLRVVANQGVTPADFDPYCITTPVDARLPGGGGQQICGFYDIKPTAFGVQDILVTKASNYGDVSQVYNGVNATVNLRLPQGAVLQGGLSTGRRETNFCGVVSSHPEITSLSVYSAQVFVPAVNLASLSRTAPFCDIAPPFLAQVKLLGVYPLPWWDLQTSATLQSIRYPQDYYQVLPGILATRAYSTTEIAPSLGRNLSGGTRSANLQILPPGTLFSDRIYQLDWRVARNFKVGKGRIQPQLDLYNLLNDNSVLTLNNTYGPRWRQPLTILPGRIVKFGMQVDY